MSKIARLVCAGLILFVGAVPVAQAADLAKRRIAGRSGAADLRRTMTLAERGDAHAQAVLGFMYANGRGVPQSYDVAVDWDVPSAEQGDLTGQYLLRLQYNKGFRGTPHIILSHKWHNPATAPS